MYAIYCQRFYVKTQSEEHRENYSMGNGTYLTNKEYIRCGWEVKKVFFWGNSDKAQYVPIGELVRPLS
ncbi:hypothetical protein FCV43_19460 [Vibrio genomosp. F6]|nr:hypothetical protein FCV43_19460 [Vibrio genomosp. F6]